LTVASKLAEANLRPFAGQEVRVIELSADAGARVCVWQKLHGYSSGAALTDHLRDAARTYCGTAGPAYLDQLARDRAGDPDALAATLRGVRDKFLTQHVPPDADGQVQSVAGWFALVGAAGELATAYEVTGWPDGEAMRAAGACFKRWLATRGGEGAAEDMQVIEAVRAFIAAHGAARFEAADPPLPNKWGDVPEPPRISNRAGWRRKDAQNQWEYLILPSVWRDEICRGLDHRRAARVCADRGLLLPTPGKAGRLTQAPRIGAHGTARVYCIAGTILEDDDGE